MQYYYRFWREQPHTAHTGAWGLSLMKVHIPQTQSVPTTVPEEHKSMISIAVHCRWTLFGDGLKIDAFLGLLLARKTSTPTFSLSFFAGWFTRSFIRLPAGTSPGAVFFLGPTKLCLSVAAVARPGQMTVDVGASPAARAPLPKNEATDAWPLFAGAPAAAAGGRPCFLPRRPPFSRTAATAAPSSAFPRRPRLPCFAKTSRAISRVDSSFRIAAYLSFAARALLCSSTIGPGYQRPCRAAPPTTTASFSLPTPVSSPAVAATACSSSSFPMASPRPPPTRTPYFSCSERTIFQGSWTYRAGTPRSSGTWRRTKAPSGSWSLPCFVTLYTRMALIPEAPDCICSWG
mmetsp:Transcript_29192/g.46002  ORF Transcript_29192/g.46002 Transcript_29192/m.46002 type:complete len:346 (-) Transcript_29192:406-1443(-)